MVMNGLVSIQQVAHSRTAKTANRTTKSGFLGVEVVVRAATEVMKDKKITKFAPCSPWCAMLSSPYSKGIQFLCGKKTQNIKNRTRREGGTMARMARMAQTSKRPQNCPVEVATR